MAGQVVARWYSFEHMRTVIRRQREDPPLQLWNTLVECDPHRTCDAVRGDWLAGWLLRAP